MRPFLPSLLLLAACQDYEIKGGDDLINDVGDDGEPDITVTPGAITFGPMAVGGDTTAIQTVTVRNDGEASLEIHDLMLANAELGSVYTISRIGSVLVPPASETTFTVTFQPLTAVEYNTEVLIDSNDPDEPQVAVPITASGEAPIILLSPETYDFGTLYIGCENAQPITISNVGNAQLEITDFSYFSASDDLYFSANEEINGPLPWYIPVGGSASVYVSYAPLDDYADEGFVRVTSNDPLRAEASAFQVGGGELYGENLDLFEQPIRGASDILFVIDNSCSMAEEQANLAANFQYFAAGLLELDLDYHIGVITTDNPAFRGEMITNEMDDIESEFITQTLVGTGGSGDEKPTEMAYQSTQSGGDAGPGSDFLRDDAMLAMIYVSDEPDSSPSTWSAYLSHFQSLKNDSDDFVSHAISGDWPSGCGSASATNNVYELSVATAGLYLSVCATDWASHLEALVDASAADLSSFELTEWPVEESIVVRVDGVVVTTGWSYDEADRSINFEESAIPEGGSTIEVEYALFGDCEG
jgi:hypothetical protein